MGIKYLRAAVCVLVVTLLLASSACGRSGVSGNDQRTTKPESALAKSALAQTAEILSAVSARTSSDDPRYLLDDTWIDGSPSCLRCTLGPAVLAAVLARVNGSDAALRAAVRSLSRAVRDDQRPDGSFASGDSEQSSRDIETVFLGNELAAAYLILGDRLPAADRELWKASLARSADFLITNGNLAYYVNGNVNLAVSENMDLVSAITKEARFTVARRTAIDFAIKPTGRWQSFGLRYTHEPAHADGSDGRGYLAESGGGAPGYDPFYTTMQLSIASQWYLLTGRAIAKRLTNLLFNEQRSRIRTSDWSIDLRGGTRASAHGTRYDFTSSALVVLALRGGRNDLRKYVTGGLAATLKVFEKATTQVNASLSYGFGLDLAPALLAVAQSKR